MPTAENTPKLSLFMIRMEDGTALITQARSEEDALQQTHVLTGAMKMVAGKKVPMSDEERQSIEVLDPKLNLGPQAFTIRELRDFSCYVTMSEDGDHFALSLTDRAVNEVYTDYPLFDAATEMIVDRQTAEMEEEGLPLEEWSSSGHRVKRIITEAIEAENERLRSPAWIVSLIEGAAK